MYYCKLTLIMISKFIFKNTFLIGILFISSKCFGQKNEVDISPFRLHVDNSTTYGIFDIPQNDKRVSFSIPALITYERNLKNGNALRLNSIYVWSNYKSSSTSNKNDFLYVLPQYIKYFGNKKQQARGFFVGAGVSYRYNSNSVSGFIRYANLQERIETIEASSLVFGPGYKHAFF